MLSHCVNLMHYFKNSLFLHGKQPFLILIFSPPDPFLTVDTDSRESKAQLIINFQRIYKPPQRLYSENPVLLTLGVC